MKKSKLFVLPLVMAMTACNNTPAAVYSTKVELPAGGTEIAPTEANKDAYKDDLSVFFTGLLGTVAQDAMKVSIVSTASATGVPFTEDAKSDINASAEIDLYCTFPTEDHQYSTAFIDVKDLSFTVTNVPTIGSIAVSGLKVSAYYRVEEDGAKFYINLSDKSVKENVVPILETLINNFAQEGLEIDAGEVYDLLLGNGKLVYTLPEFYPVPESEETYPDPLGYYLLAGRMGLLFTLMQLNLDAMIESLEPTSPSFVEYRDEAGELTKLGLSTERDLLEDIGLVEDLVPQTLIDGEEPAEEEPSPINTDMIRTAKAGIGMLFGEENGSDGFALEYLGTKVNVETTDNATIRGEVTANAYYNNQAHFMPLTNNQAAQYELSLNALIELIKAMIEAGGAAGIR